MAFAELTEKTYDAEALAEVSDLAAMRSQGETLSNHLYRVFYEFFTQLLRQRFPHDTVVSAMKRHSLDVVADRWTAVACRRVSRCFGLPADGHVVHTIQQGRVRFLGVGPNASLKAEVARGCKSKWDLSAHRCGAWLLGHSAVGKDNALAAHHSIVRHLRTHFPDLCCFNELGLGHLTYPGLLEDVDSGASPDGQMHWLTWTKFEISQCFGEGAHAVREKDFCQLTECAPIGKRVKGKRLRKSACTSISSLEPTFVL